VADRLIQSEPQQAAVDGREEQETRAVDRAPAARLRPSRGFVIGIILSVPLWAALIVLGRTLLAWLR
jgi:hypothetical protein